MGGKIQGTLLANLSFIFIPTHNKTNGCTSAFPDGPIHHFFCHNHASTTVAVPKEITLFAGEPKSDECNENEKRRYRILLSHQGVCGGMLFQQALLFPTWDVKDWHFSWNCGGAIHRAADNNWTTSVPADLNKLSITGGRGNGLYKVTETFPLAEFNKLPTTRDRQYSHKYPLMITR